jgi:hypothetical protein
MVNAMMVYAARQIVVSYPVDQRWRSVFDHWGKAPVVVGFEWTAKKRQLTYEKHILKRSPIDLGMGSEFAKHGGSQY